MNGGLTVRLASGPDDLARLRALRARAFGLACDEDPWDLGARHLMVERADGDVGEPVATLRLRAWPDGRAAAQGSYSAQHYDLAPFAGEAGPLLEIGRLTLPPGPPGAEAARALFAALARIVLADRVRWLFGCAALSGADPARHGATLAALAAHVGPAALRPHPRAGAIPLPPPGPGRPAPLFAFYLSLGGWLSDHAVADAELDTLHLFTAVDIAAIPPARAEALRRLAE